MGKKGKRSTFGSKKSGNVGVDQPVSSTLPTGVRAGDTLFAQACALHQQGNIDGALKLYQQSVQADPTLSGA